jgi:ATP synthase protein I
MTDGKRPEEPENRREGSDFSRAVARRVRRKLLARGDRAAGVWFGLGMMGLVGWSVAVPTLLGAMLGVWLDKQYPAPYSWTLSLLVAGLLLGCLNAWRWIARENRAINDRPEDEKEERDDEQ